jgi:hypothetical protein
MLPCNSKNLISFFPQRFVNFHKSNRFDVVW